MIASAMANVGRSQQPLLDLSLYNGFGARLWEGQRAPAISPIREYPMNPYLVLIILLAHSAVIAYIRAKFGGSRGE